MYAELQKSKKTFVCLWCDGYSEENEHQGKRKRDGSSSGSSSKRAAKEKDIDRLVTALKEMHQKNIVILNIDCGPE